MKLTMRKTKKRSTNAVWKGGKFRRARENYINTAVQEKLIKKQISKNPESFWQPNRLQRWLVHREDYYPISENQRQIALKNKKREKTETCANNDELTCSKNS